MSHATLLLTGAELRRLLPPADCIGAVEAAFGRQAAEPAAPAGVLGFRVPGGGFHVKAAVMPGNRWFAVKLNGNFPGNPERRGLPTIQGVVALADAADGRLLALMDSIEITRLRTGAASAVAAKYLARPDSETLMIFGCGRQALDQLFCLASVLPIRRLFAYDLHSGAAADLVGQARTRLGIEAEAVTESSMAERARSADVIVTCTPSQQAFLTSAHVSPGTFVAAVGADDSHKQEVDPALMASATVVVDVLEQCLTIGDLHHAVRDGVIRADAVRGELGDLVAGRIPGRSELGEITIFDSTGTALEDVAAAAMAYERAVERGVGLWLELGGVTAP